MTFEWIRVPEVSDSGDETDHILPDAIDWSGMFEKAYPKPEIKETEEEKRARMWKAVQEFSIC